MADAELARRAEDLAGRIGFNTASVANRPLEEAADVGRRLGLGGIELLAFADYRNSQGDIDGRYFDRLTDEDRELLVRATAGFAHIAVHAPFWEISPFSPNPAIGDASRDQLRATIEASAELGAATVTTHFTPRPAYELAEYRDEVLGLYRELGDLAGGLGLTVTIETGQPRAIEVFAALIHDIDHPAVGANVDVGHLRGLLTPEQQRSEEAPALYAELLARHVDSLGRKILHAHLHDISAADFRDHRECGTGFLDLTDFFRRLLALDYRGLANFEVDEPEAEGALSRSYQRVREMIAAAAR